MILKCLSIYLSICMFHLQNYWMDLRQIFFFIGNLHKKLPSKLCFGSYWYNITSILCETHIKLHKFSKNGSLYKKLVHNIKYRFQVEIWVVTLCGVMVGYQHFRGQYYMASQPRRLQLGSSPTWDPQISHKI